MTETYRPFCPAPFREFRLSTAGDLSLCAPSRLRTPVVGNILRDGIEGSWNSEQARDFRRSILDGSFSNCKAAHCPALQKQALPDAPSIQNPRLRDIIDNQRVVLEDGPTSLNLSYDITCNLKCPACRPSIVGLKGRDLERVLALKDLLLKSSIIDGASSLLLCGFGDPFASRPHLEFLRSLDVHRFRKLRIVLLTNGLLLTPQMWRTFPDAHPLIEEIAISIDAATAETYTLNRGGKFDRLLENLEFISELRRDSVIRTFRINFVVQANNFREMPSFVALGSGLGADTVLFQKLANAGNAHMHDYTSRAVHLEDHPDNKEFRQLLQHEIFLNPIVELYTISDQRINNNNSKNEEVDVSTQITAATDNVLISTSNDARTSSASRGLSFPALERFRLWLKRL